MLKSVPKPIKLDLDWALIFSNLSITNKYHLLHFFHTLFYEFDSSHILPKIITPPILF